MPVITLITDFGVQDHNSAIVKGQLLQHINNTAHLIDISHTVANYNLPQAAYFLESSLQNFSKNTYHIVLVNLFEQNIKRVLCFQQNGQTIFTADNGFVNLIKETKEPVWAIPLATNLPFNTINFVQTIAKCINWLDAQNSIDDLGDKVMDYMDKHSLKPIVTDDALEGYIIYVDQYENVVTNITKSLFTNTKRNRKFKIVFKRDEMIDTIVDSYAAVPQGEKLALFNTSGYLEIAINQGNAAGLFGLLSVGSNQNNNNSFLQKGLYYQTVKIYFEN